MVVESDNNATNLLSRQLKPDLFRKIFTDLDIPPDEIHEVIDYSESAFVFKRNSPYSLTIMTKGTDISQQTELISELSEEVFRNYGSH